MKTSISALALLGSSAVLAQQPPSDNELRAAYCTGYSQAWSQAINKSNEELSKLAAAGNNEARDLLNKMSAVRGALDKRITRLQGYLLPKSRYLEPTSMMFALEQGRQDYARGIDEAGTCIAKCVAAKVMTHCAERCGETELGRRAAQCQDLSWLPF